VTSLRRAFPRRQRDVAALKQAGIDSWPSRPSPRAPTPSGHGDGLRPHPERPRRVGDTFLRAMADFSLDALWLPDWRGLSRCSRSWSCGASTSWPHAPAPPLRADIGAGDLECLRDTGVVGWLWTAMSTTLGPPAGPAQGYRRPAAAADAPPAGAGGRGVPAGRWCPHRRGRGGRGGGGGLPVGSRKKARRAHSRAPLRGIRPCLGSRSTVSLQLLHDPQGIPRVDRHVRGSR